jgi:hypothetical protein
MYLSTDQPFVIHPHLAHARGICEALTLQELHLWIQTYRMVRKMTPGRTL